MSGAPSTGFDASSLEGMPLEDLRAVWRERFGAPPLLRSPELLGLMLAWRIQAGETGGLDPDTRRSLRRATSTRPDAGPSGGTKLVREWQGVRHEVIALDDGGFLFEGARHKSLSQVARLITGTRWNGPRFFGLRQSEAAA